MNVENVNFAERKHKIAQVDVDTKEQIPLKQDLVYLRICCDFTNKKDSATFYYSLDNEQWHQLGTEIKMIFDHTRMFMCSKFAIFNYATQQEGGYVYIAQFDYQ